MVPIVHACTIRSISFFKSMFIYASSVSDTLTTAPSDSIHGTKISRHLSGSCPIHPPQTYNTFLPLSGEVPSGSKARQYNDGTMAAAAMAAALFSLNDLRV